MGPRARDLGVVIGRLGPGPHNAITDVDGVSVGQATVVRDEPSVARTGVTAIWPHTGDPWRERVYAGTAIVNGYGELIGIDQINEWGLLHSPVVITSSLAIGLAYDTTARWIAEREPAQGRSDVIMPVVTECDDSFLNDARAFPLSPPDVVAALDGASRGEVAEGCVGAGTGMQCFDFKGGIGTASRVVADAAGDLTVGVLVCTNFGARPDLTIAGVPVLPLALPHGAHDVLGYRMGGVAYLTDVKSIPEDVIAGLAGLEVLVLNALLSRPHPLHLSIPEAVAAAQRIGARRTYFTHLTHEFTHAALAAMLPHGVAPAYDGLVIDVVGA